jgi:XTP/dITP diphosphohydrolase
MRLKKIYFVTKNDYKFQKFIESVSKFDLKISFEQVKIDTPEIQANNNSSVAKYSARWASIFLKSPVVCEDVGLYIKNLNNFPGPYLSEVENYIDNIGVLKLMKNVNDRSAHWEYSVAFCKPNTNPISFSTYPKGFISKTIKGNSGWPTDKIFIPKNSNFTISELIDHKIFKRSSEHYIKLLKYLKQNY